MDQTNAKHERAVLKFFIAVLFLVLIAGGIFLWFLLTPNRVPMTPNREWRLAEAWDGENLNHPSATGKTMVDGAIKYLDTQPVYDGSKIYPGGVPNDGTGVCTDVIYYAAKAVGINLRTLVDEDRRADPGAYASSAFPGEQPNPDIDYRRVRNLMVYFDRHAESLTKDTSDVAAWQPGDIVVWHEHIAVISDRRNAAGLPYVLHHEGVEVGARYEKDAFAERGEVLRHYRLDGLAAQVADQ